MAIVVIGGLCALEIGYEINAYHKEVIAPFKAEILVCGDSQTETGIDDASFPKFFNFGDSGRRLDQSMLIIEDVLKMNPGKFKKVILDIPPSATVEDFSVPLPQAGFAGQYWLLHCLHPWENIRPTTGLLKSMRDSLVGRRLRKFRRILRGKEKFRSSLCGGFRRLEGNLKEDSPDDYKIMLDDALSRSKDKGIGEISLSSPAFRIVDRIIAIANENGAQTILMTTPWSEDMQVNLSEEELNHFTDVLNEYAKLRSCEYLDFLRVHFDGQYWHDANHLTVSGAKILTEMIGRNIKW